MEWIAPTIVVAGMVVIWMSIAQMQGRLERTESKLNALINHFKIDLNQGRPLSDRVKELAADPARKIEAIKAYREETGAGLAEAKEAVEAFIYSR